MSRYPPCLDDKWCEEAEGRPRRGSGLHFLMRPNLRPNSISSHPPRPHQPILCINVSHLGHILRLFPQLPQFPSIFILSCLLAWYLQPLPNVLIIRSLPADRLGAELVGLAEKAGICWPIICIVVFSLASLTVMLRDGDGNGYCFMHIDAQADGSRREMRGRGTLAMAVSEGEGDTVLA
ncbi:hypothetical protein QR685DRAFT_581323 [Neurospora intermedia]|uniref:Uncharacterized protein n=1 Tax=Neurospora intermedia TaxID=5142 RepID=A0ABR3CZV1_NEUIN